LRENWRRPWAGAFFCLGDASVADPKCAPDGEARRKGSISNFRVIDDADSAGAIPYLSDAG
jgi:hypothetical protein